MEYYKSYQSDPSDFRGVLTQEWCSKKMEHLLMVKSGGNNFMIAENNRALIGDEIRYRELKTTLNSVSNSNIENQVEITGIHKRTQDKIVGILQLNTNQKYGFNKKKVPYYKFSPLSPKYPTFIVPSKTRERRSLLVVIEFNRWNTSDKHPIGQIYTEIGLVGDLNNEIEALLFMHNLLPKKQKIKYLPNQTEHNSDISDVYDTISIDPSGCVDIDDSLSWTFLDNNKARIGIHIANVARRIDLISLFNSAKLNVLNLTQTQTIYDLNDGKQLNMLDDSLTINDFSLGDRPIEPKHAISLFITIDLDSDKILDKEFKLTRVNNRAISYDDATHIIDASKLTNYYSDIRYLYKYATRHLGSEDLSLELPTTQKMVEFYMLLYNQTTAELLYKKNNYTILRTHGMGTSIGADTGSGADKPIYSEHLGNHLNKKQLSAAIYEVDPVKTTHSGLGLQYYTHATSPIRRFVDIINQINITKYIYGEEPFLILNNSNINQINQFDKNLRKFYNNNKKLSIMFSNPETPILNVEAYIIELKHIRAKLYIPSLDIEHTIYIISPKLATTQNNNKIVYSESTLQINDTIFSLYQRVIVDITKLPFSEKFKDKLFIQIVNPPITLL